MADKSFSIQCFDRDLGTVAVDEDSAKKDSSSNCYGGLVDSSTFDLFFTEASGHGGI